MFPIHNYAEFQRRQAQLIKEAEIERLLRQAGCDRPEALRLRHIVVLWLGLHLIQWGQKLKHMSASHNCQHTASI